MTRLPSLGPRGEGWVLAQIALFALVLASGFSGAAWVGIQRAASTTLAGILALAGAVLAGRGLRDLGANLTPLPHPRDDASLVDDGVYAHVRHPIYGGLVLLALAWACLAAAPLAFVTTALLLLFFEAKSRREEAWLVGRHPGYADYRRRTRRFFPLVH